MAQFNENITLAAPNPLDKRYLSTGTTNGSQLPYSGVSEVYALVPITVRYSGQTFLIRSGGANVEYWFKDGIQNSNLIQKKYDSIIPVGAFVTGGTNIGYFSGFTGIQYLPINHITNNAFGGTYQSLYNYYYRGIDGKIHIGSPNDGIARRGYVKLTSPVQSWIWSDYVGGANSELVGWTFISGNIANLVGTFQNAGLPLYYNGTTALPYNQTGWTTGTAIHNNTLVTISTITGSLTTGNTLTIGARPFAFKDHNNLHFRTIVSDTPANLKIRDDNDALIHISGSSISMSAQNLGTFGLGVYDSTSGSTFLFKKLVGGSNTTITDLGTRLVIDSTGGASATYDLDSPSVITVGGIPSGTTLIGKTSFQLFEELLVPTLQPVFVAPSNSIVLSPTSGTICEIGYIIPVLSLTSNFDRGSYTPAYFGGTAFGSGLPVSHTFTGKGSSISGTTTTTNLSFTKTADSLSFTVSQGCSYFTTNVSYSAGLQANDSKGAPSTCAPVNAGTTGVKTACIVGAYPIWATCASISVCNKIVPLFDMTIANAVPIILSPESSGYKQKFQIPCAWLSARPLMGVCQFNIVSGLWEYPLSSQAASLTLWNTSAAVELVQGNSIGYCEYRYNGVDRSTVCIRLVF